MPQATPAPNINIDPPGGGADRPGNRSATSPASAKARPANCRARSRSPCRMPQEIIVAWTAPNNSNAPVPAERVTYANEKAAAYVKSARAEAQFPVALGFVFRILTMSQSATAPEEIRMKVNDAA